MTKARDLSQTPNASLGFKNRIINGAMMIDQRNAGASVTPTVNGTYLIDRWVYGLNGAGGKFAVQQNAGAVTPPVGFTNYFGCTSNSAYSITSNDVQLISHNIEGFNVADLAWGTANAKTVTLSFWAYSSLTGTFGGSIRNSGDNRSYPFSYTISSANTWEQKSVTIAGDTSGTWLTNNGVGLRVSFSLGTGSTYSGTAGSWSSSALFSATGATSVVGTNGATFYITGVQLEKGSTATSFDYRPYGTELALCQRYYWKSQAANSYSAFGSGTTDVATQCSVYIKFPVTMRATPTLTFSGNISAYSGSGNYPITSTASSYAAYDQALWQFTCAGGGMTAGRGITVIANADNNAYLAYTAEL